MLTAKQLDSYKEKCKELKQYDKEFVKKLPTDISSLTSDEYKVLNKKLNTKLSYLRREAIFNSVDYFTDNNMY